MKRLLPLVVCLTLLSCDLLAQQILIPYRIGNLWGLADTNLKIVVKPAYDSILHDKGNGGFYSRGSYRLVIKNANLVLSQKTRL